jgi:hypothetical protein
MVEGLSVQLRVFTEVMGIQGARFLGFDERSPGLVRAGRARGAGKGDELVKKPEFHWNLLEIAQRWPYRSLRLDDSRGPISIVFGRIQG